MGKKKEKAKSHPAETRPAEKQPLTGKPLRWFNTAYHTDQTGYGMPPEPTGKRRVIPRSVLRQMAKANHEGGRATCYFCHETFNISYCKLVRVDWRTIEHVCADCKYERGLHDYK